MPAALPAALYLGVYLLTLADALVPQPWLAGAAAAGLAAFVLLELPRIRTGQRVAAAVLICGGLAAAAFDGGAAAVWRDLVEGLVRALPFMVLFAAVMCLQVPALASPAFRSLGARVVAQPPGRRYLMLALAGHYLGAVLNLAGLQLVASLLDPGMRAGLRRRLTIAVVRGFSSAVLWSPFFVGMGVILTVLPQVSWLDLGPLGLALGLGFVALAWALDRVLSRRGREAAPAPQAAAGDGLPAGRAAAGVAAVFLLLAVPVIGLSEAGGLSIVIALGLVAPAMAVAWGARLRRGGVRTDPVLATVVGRLPGLRNEAVLFLAATVFAVGLADAVDAAQLGGLLAQPDWPPALRTAALALGGTLLGGLGVHPVVPAILVGEILTPQVLGLPPLAVALVLAIIWGMGTQMSPVSATNMQVARWLSVPVLRVAWGWNAPYCLPAAGLAGAVVGLAAG
jgi:hypothetical protein